MNWWMWEGQRIGMSKTLLSTCTGYKIKTHSHVAWQLVQATVGSVSLDADCLVRTWTQQKVITCVTVYNWRLELIHKPFAALDPEDFLLFFSGGLCISFVSVIPAVASATAALRISDGRKRLWVWLISNHVFGFGAIRLLHALVNIQTLFLLFCLHKFSFDDLSYLACKGCQVGNGTCLDKSTGSALIIAPCGGVYPEALHTTDCYAHHWI